MGTNDYAQFKERSGTITQCRYILIGIIVTEPIKILTGGTFGSGTSNLVVFSRANVALNQDPPITALYQYLIARYQV